MCCQTVYLVAARGRFPIHIRRSPRFWCGKMILLQPGGYTPWLSHPTFLVVTAFLVCEGIMTIFGGYNICLSVSVSVSLALALSHMRRSLELFIVFYSFDVRRFLDYSLRFCPTESRPRRGCRSLLFWLHKSHVCAGLEASDGNIP